MYIEEREAIESEVIDCMDSQSASKMGIFGKLKITFEGVARRIEVIISKNLNDDTQYRLKKLQEGEEKSRLAQFYYEYILKPQQKIKVLLFEKKSSLFFGAVEVLQDSLIVSINLYINPTKYFSYPEEDASGTPMLHLAS